MTDQPPKSAGASSSINNSHQDWEDAYKARTAALILKTITEDGKIETYTAFRQVVALTNRTLSTVKNWLAYQNSFPDLGSLARIVEHWRIPPELIFPADFFAQLANLDKSSSLGEVSPALNDLQSFNLMPLRPTDDPVNRSAMLYYSKNPEKALFIRQEDSDNEQIRLGELAMIDPTIEELRGDGFYLLKIGRAGNLGPTICLRFITTMIGEPALRLSRGSSATPDNVEMLPLLDGGLPHHIVILGKVVAVLRKFF